jgi:hypothetical protein
MEYWNDEEGIMEWWNNVEEETEYRRQKTFTEETVRCSSFDTSGRTEVLFSILSWFSVRGQVSNHERNA